MSLNNKLNDIVEYVYHKLPGLDFENLSVTDKSVNDICNAIFPGLEKNIFFKKIQKTCFYCLKRVFFVLNKFIYIVFFSV